MSLQFLDSNLCKVLAFHWEVGSNHCRRVTSRVSADALGVFLTLQTKSPSVSAQQTWPKQQPVKTGLFQCHYSDICGQQWNDPRMGPISAGSLMLLQMAATASAGTIHLTELQTNPSPCLVPPQKKLSSFWLPAMQLERLATELMENKQPLPHAQLLFPSFSSYSRFLNEPDVFHIHGKKIFLGMTV